MLPQSVDLSADKYFPEIGHQQIGACISWASTYYQFTYEAAKLNNWDAKNDASKRFSPKFTYNYINSVSDLGVDFEDTYKVLTNTGCVRYTEFPPTYIDGEYKDWFNNGELIRKGMDTRVTASFKHFVDQNDFAGTLADIKNTLNEKHPTTFASTIFDWRIGKLSNGQNVCIANYAKRLIML